MSIENWNIDSTLSRAGYTADGSLSERQRIRCMEFAIGGHMSIALGVMHHFTWLIDSRRHRHDKACRIWQQDRLYVIRKINAGGLLDDNFTPHEIRKARHRDIWANVR